MKVLSINEIKSRLEDVQDLNDPFLNSLRIDERKGVQNLFIRKQKQIKKHLQAVKDHEARQTYERHYWNKGYQVIAGVDEVGRGPLAGPIVAAAVVLPQDNDALLGVTDSKKLSHKQIEHFAKLIKIHALAYAVCVKDNHVIDQVNIYQASKLAMEEAIGTLGLPVDFILADAMTLNLSIPQRSLIKGDAKSLSIAAASIIAKDFRDRVMVDYSKQYPEFDFEHNVGYGTAKHLEALKTYGYTPIHRQTFSPVGNMKQYKEK